MQRTLLTRYLDPEVLARMSGLPLEPRNLVLGNLAGAHRSPLAGFAVEFAGHREYAPGDDPKHIDWRVYFTREKYFIKQYEMETNFTCHLALDVSASMRYGEGRQSKLHYAAQMAAALGYSIVRQSDRVGLMTFDNALRGAVPPSNTMSQIVRMTDLLDSTEAVDKTDLNAALSPVVARTGRREIVMIFSDFLCDDIAALEPVLQQLRYRRHEVVLFHVLHHDEIAFDLDGMVKFVGLEGDEPIVAQPSELREAYQRALHQFEEQLETIALRNRCERVAVDTSRNVGEVLADYLHQRSRVA